MCKLIPYSTALCFKVLEALETYNINPFVADRLLGKFVLGSYMFARGRALQHWNSALAAPMEQVKQWHPLTN